MHSYEMKDPNVALLDVLPFHDDVVEMSIIVIQYLDVQHFILKVNRIKGELRFFHDDCHFDS